MSGFPSVTPLIVLENEGMVISGLTISGVGMFFLDFPNISTDRARLALRVWGNGNRVLMFYADGYFSIRHDPRFGFVPPSVTMLTPAGGESFPGGSVIPVTWDASANEGLHSFDILASYNAGRTWHPIVRELPAEARRFDWRLPASDGIADVRVRVIAKDLRFQNSSDDTNGSIQILPGQGCYADCDPSTGIGVLDIFDFLCFQNSFASGGSYACDCDTTTGPLVCDIFDFLCFQNAFVAGCP